jgi:hypothetical protein
MTAVNVPQAESAFWAKSDSRRDGTVDPATARRGPVVTQPMTFSPTAPIGPYPP